MTPTRKIALFVTCLVDQIMPEIGAATVKVLRRTGYHPFREGHPTPPGQEGELHFPASQTCCGQPFFNSGFEAESRRLAKKTIQTLEPFDAVVLPSGSCSAMIRVEYAHLLVDEPAWAERARALAAKTFELSEFLLQTNHFPAASKGGGPPVTYHDSCHMCRMLGLRDEPREALRRAGCQTVEMAEPDRCCGFGGLFSVRMPEVSNAMTTEKLRLAAETGVQTLVTADPGCLMQMRGLQHRHPSLRVKHLAVILEEHTR